ncbi:PhzF family phenazine biosynthesis protein [Endozoicomonas sp. SM1973]|uniref:PhzF family phenazine biosynthesis protein n=1 Tax=Spartinivicinus marinus TaxID=2994442 RepID=A0A853I361_9GAMM|nr:PhzF family phenazine biosynthesis protein [Spartinivicinus marinus]MCX4028191.1 PhzF family phenazine biosynthesis protein [Spartinivicinus marinus]NYZ68390.1 PhzF family phenazine biosynthesis protein [Spartinivicinus marinus]
MHKYTIVNSFGCDPFTGNPVAVFFDCDDLNAKCMQQLAAELNLSETTFICLPQNGGDARVKIFTPVNQLGFAGHPLLGTAVALAKTRKCSKIKIETLKGTFQFSVEPVKESPFTAHVEMEQPTPVISSYEYQQALLEALGIAKSTLPVDMYDVGPRHVFVGVESISVLSKISPDLKKLSVFKNMAALCFSPDDAGGWRLRMFSPAYGVAEDAATGSAAGPLALHLCRYGFAEFGENIKITQGVEMGRPSRMNAVACMEQNTPSIKAGGYGFQIATGEYFV